MQYTVVHSKDPYLLARLATDLQMEGEVNDIAWNNYCNPFYKSTTRYLHTGDKEGFQFFSHRIVSEPTIFLELTSRNYIKVLTQILQP